jgi:hypothetical protein
VGFDDGIQSHWWFFSFRFWEPCPFSRPRWHDFERLGVKIVNEKKGIVICISRCFNILSSRAWHTGIFFCSLFFLGGRSSDGIPFRKRPREHRNFANSKMPVTLNYMTPQCLLNGSGHYNAHKEFIFANSRIRAECGMQSYLVSSPDFPKPNLPRLVCDR